MLDLLGVNLHSRPVKTARECMFGLISSCIMSNGSMQNVKTGLTHHFALHISAHHAGESKPEP